MRENRYLIVNADDFGYFPCVSQGISEAIHAGAVTATSIMANRPGINQQLALLTERPRADLGVHLNLTFGLPLTHVLRAHLPHGLFPSKFWWALRTALGGRLLRDTGDELRAQISKCVGAGLSICFLNSHEHVHMLPALFNTVTEIAQEFQIPFVRHSRPDWRFSTGASAALRNGLLQALYTFQYNRRRKAQVPLMHGASVSGRIDLRYLNALIRSLRQGAVVELMCHPGLCTASDVDNSKLAAYHAWRQEYEVLTSNAFAQMCARENVKRARFSDLLQRDLIAH
jgi:hypothetical protein